MAEPLALRCAAESLSREEPQFATASRVQRWLVVEQPGAWGRDAVAASGLDPEVAAALADSARHHRVRVLLARRAGDWRRFADRHAFLAHSGTERAWLEQLAMPADEPRRLLDVDLGVTAFGDPPGVGAPGSGLGGLALVCTNGRHDPCCADLGRPVVRTLVAAGAADVWEASHVGGDRFAANIVSLPDGVYYGRVEPDRAPGLLADHRAGLLDLDCYRGRSCHPPVIQAAEWFARHELGERRLDALGMLGAEQRPDGTYAVLVQPRGADTLEVVVAREQAAPVQLTCHKPELGRPWHYRLVALRPA
jgi:hypothetical protein